MLSLATLDLWFTCPPDGSGYQPSKYLVIYDGLL
jgi:hypothetical protein